MLCASWRWPAVSVVSISHLRMVLWCVCLPIAVMFEDVQCRLRAVTHGSCILGICAWCKGLKSPPACGCNISMIVSHKFNAGIPCTHYPAFSEIISASLLPWDTAVCFLISTYAIYTEHHLKWTSGPSNVLQNRILRRDSSRSYARFHFVTDRAEYFTVRRKFDHAILARSNHVKTIWEQISEKAPTIFKSSVCTWWSSKQSVETNEIGQLSCAPLRKSVQHSFERNLPNRSSKLWCLSILFLSFDISFCAHQPWEQLLFFHHNSVAHLCCSLSTSTKKLDQTSILGLPKPTFICRCAHIFGILFVVPDFLR